MIDVVFVLYCQNFYLFWIFGWLYSLWLLDRDKKYSYELSSLVTLKLTFTTDRLVF